MDRRRYPLSNLLEATGLSEHQFGSLVGLTGTPLKRAREIGFTSDAADRYAQRAGFAAQSIWFDYGLRECIREGCTTMFAPVDKRHKCCSRPCAIAMWAKTPKGRASLRAAHRRWRASSLEYARRIDREQSKKWRAANPERVKARDRARYQAQAKETRVDHMEKRRRVRFVRAEVLMELATTAQQWADDVNSERFAKWPRRHPMRRLCATYRLSPAELGDVLTTLADQTRARAERTGLIEARTYLNECQTP